MTTCKFGVVNVLFDTSASTYVEAPDIYAIRRLFKYFSCTRMEWIVLLRGIR